MGSIVMGRRPKLKTVVVPRQKYPEACVWQHTSNLLVLFKFFVGYSFLVSRPRRHGGEPHLPATGPTLRSGAGLDLGGVGGGGMPPPVTLAAPAELS